MAHARRIALAACSTSDQGSSKTSVAGCKSGATRTSCACGPQKRRRIGSEGTTSRTILNSGRVNEIQTARCLACLRGRSRTSRCQKPVSADARSHKSPRRRHGNSVLRPSFATPTDESSSAVRLLRGARTQVPFPAHRARTHSLANCVCVVWPTTTPTQKTHRQRRRARRAGHEGIRNVAAVRAVRGAVLGVALGHRI